MTSAVRSLAILISAAALSAVVLMLPSSSDAQTNACVDLTRTLRLGSTDAETSGEVTKLQQYLTQTGDYTYGSITGYFGPATEAAVQRFQCRKGIICQGTPEGTGYGVVGARTRAAMRCTGGGGGGSPFTCSPINRALYLGHTDATTGGDVTKLQNMLAKLGYYTAGINGTFDAATETAVKRFQCAEGIICAGDAETTGYGVVGPRTRQLLFTRCQSGGTPPPQGELIFSASPTSIMSGQSVQLSWSSNLGSVIVSGCSISANGTRVVSNRIAPGTFDHSPTINTTYVIQCTKYPSGSIGVAMLPVSFYVTVTPEITVCQQDAFQCPDGRWVGRTGPQCTFNCADGPVNPGPTIESIDGPTSRAVDETGRWTVNATGEDPLSYRMYWGDGTSSGPSFSAQFEHSYLNDGNFSIEALVTDFNGVQSSKRLSVRVGDPPVSPPGVPVEYMRLVASPASVASGQSVTLSWVVPSTSNFGYTASCTLYGNNVLIASNLAGSRTYTHTPLVSTTYRIDCDQSGPNLPLKSYSGSTYVSVGTTGNGQCSQEARQCPDGSYVGRTGPRCEFAECPGGNGGGTIRLIASPASITAGQSVTLTWVTPQFTTDAATCKLYANDVQIGWNFTTQTSYTHSPGSSTTYRITCTDVVLRAYSGSTYVTVAPQVGGGLPTIYLSATPSSVESGQMVTLSWTRSSNASWTIGACTITANGVTIASNRAMPSTMTHNPTSVTSYGIQCTGTGPSGSTAFTASASVGVTGGVDPYTSFNFTALPSSVTAGQAVTLRASNNPGKNDVYIPSCSFTANGVTLSALTIDPGGNIVTTTHAPQVNTTYVARCQMSSGGYTTETRYVTIAGTVGNTVMYTSPSVINSGQSTTAHWNIASGESCFIEHKIGAGLPVKYSLTRVTGSGSWTISPSSHVQFGMGCTYGGEAQRYAYTAVRGANIVLFADTSGNVSANDGASAWFRIVDAEGSGYQHSVHIDGLERTALAAGVDRFDATLVAPSTQDGQNHTVRVCRKSGAQLTLCSANVSFKQRCDSTPGGACNPGGASLPTESNLASVLVAFEELLKLFSGYVSKASN